MLLLIRAPIFLWNVFPLHPYQPGDQLSNRTHNRDEREACRPLLAWVLEKLAPTKVIAIGRDAQDALSELRVQSIPVRHPSYGGQGDFVRDITTIYHLPSRLFATGAQALMI
jgi:uracil-DNA glycosylase